MPSLKIDSAPRKTLSSIKSLFEFLTDFRNFGSLLPPEKVADFQATEQQCSFKVQGVAALTVQLQEKNPFDRILFNVSGPANSVLKLDVIFSGPPDAPGMCDVQMAAHLNPFLKAMAEKPLRSLVNTIAQKITELEV